MASASSASRQSRIPISLRPPSLTSSARDAGNEPLVAHLQASVRERRLLLVLDNYERVLDAAPLVTDLLGAAPGIRILVTSRTRLRLSGEHEHVVPPLRLADPGEHVSHAAGIVLPALPPLPVLTP